MGDVPVIDVAPLLTGADDVSEPAAALDRACREVGFFTVVGHGVDVGPLAVEARRFFALDDAEKAQVAMAHAGRAWRGWFPLGGELTSGVPDQKEGIYFGAEGPPSDLAMHGPNLFPAHPAGLRPAVLAYMAAMTALGAALLEGLGVGLGIGRLWFAEHLTASPTVLFRIFRYPAAAPGWGVAEHTDYGLLTMLAQDGPGGLQVRCPSGWTDVELPPGALVCNIGDMLERLTGGRYRSTPHRVRNGGTTDRLSFPFFYDPSWDAVVPSVFERPLEDGAGDRWDHTSVHEGSGTYGDYLSAKVAKVFPDLRSG